MIIALGAYDPSRRDRADTDATTIGWRRAATRQTEESSAVEIALTGHGLERFATPRLVGRRLLPADGDFLVDLHEDAHVMTNHGGSRTRAATEPFVQSNVAHWRRYQFGLYILSLAEDPEQPIGRAGIRLDRRIAPHPAIDASVVLARTAWGQGIGTEALSAVTTIGLSRGDRVTAGSEADNGAARRVMEKVGFVYWSDHEHQGRLWVRYRWPDATPGTATILKQPV